MAIDQKAAVIVSLNGMNYVTWRVQCQVALICKELWGIANETERAQENLGEQVSLYIVSFILYS